MGHDEKLVQVVTPEFDKSVKRKDTIVKILVDDYKWSKYQFRQKYILIEERYSKEQMDKMEIEREKEMSESLKKIPHNGGIYKITTKLVAVNANIWTVFYMLFMS
jgi:septum formation inhibitor-activating ATPase MinD